MAPSPDWALKRRYRLHAELRYRASKCEALSHLLCFPLSHVLDAALSHVACSRLHWRGRCKFNKFSDPLSRISPDADGLRDSLIWRGRDDEFDE